MNQLQTCQGSAPSALAAVQSGIITITNQIAQIQSNIIALQLKSDEITLLSDLTKIPSLFVQVTGSVKPAITESLALAAQTETGLNLQNLLSYQEQLSLCVSQPQEPQG